MQLAKFNFNDFYDQIFPESCVNDIRVFQEEPYLLAAKEWLKSCFSW